jgi:hypothetical protein
MRGLRWSVWAAAATAAVLAAVAVGAGAARAGGSATLTLAVYPGTLAPGGSGALAATFTNNGPSTLTHVIVNVVLPSPASFDAADSSPVCGGSGQTVSCSLGDLQKGVTIVSTVAFTGAPSSGPVSFSAAATWDAASVGNPKGAAASKSTTSYTLSNVAVLDTTGGFVSSSCTAHGGSLSAANGGYATDVSAGDNTLGLTCTPIMTGIDGSDRPFVKLPPLKTPATVVLTFPDERLPWPSGDSNYPVPNSRDLAAPTELIEYPAYPSLNGAENVPWCDAAASSPPGPVSSDSCIVSIQSTDEGESQDNDADRGTVTLRVQGSATGDPGYNG